MNVPFIQFCPSLKGYLRRDEWLSLFQFYRKTLLRSVDPKQQQEIVT